SWRAPRSSGNGDRIARALRALFPMMLGPARQHRGKLGGARCHPENMPVRANDDRLDTEAGEIVGRFAVGENQREAAIGYLIATCARQRLDEAARPQYRKMVADTIIEPRAVGQARLR